MAVTEAELVRGLRRLGVCSGDYLEADREGLLSRTRVGAATALLFDARPVIDVSVRLRRQQPYLMAGVEPPP